MQAITNSSFDYYDILVSQKNRSYDAFLMFKGSELDFSPRSLTKTAKTACSMANSGGGQIIYGISCKYNRAERIDPVRKFTKNAEWLFNEIQSHIDKPIKDLEINFVPVPGSENDCIIHMTIPLNNNQPHMFSDNRFYRLQKGKSVLMDESEVRMLYGKVSHCDLEFLGIYNTNGLPILSSGKYSSMSFYPKFLIRNAGNKVEKDFKIEISFPASLYEETFQPLNAIFIRHEGSHAVFGQKGNYPIFQEEISTMIEAKIAVNTENLETFLKEYINIKLFFSNGIKQHKIKLSETLTYNGKKLAKDDFNSLKEIKTIEI